ncbi:MAG: A/G-specific adenine glycosylase [Acidobacteria bacterium]|nr:A/G-specific adenine glycosylase [Acidobacteriota bacterium]
MRSRLLGWYDQHRRPLPWRQNCDPYRVWVSEIMLQQTRVAAVRLRYEAFLKQFPCLRALAGASEASVLAAWSGLGYYRRARNLHAAAKLVLHQRQGKFPQGSDEWRELPGIGRYTAAAIASIAFQEPIAVVDGNVERVLARLLADSVRGEKLWQVAQEFLDPKRPGDFNQGLMELGATICLPIEPRCPECPLRRFCHSRGTRQRTKRSLPRSRREIAYSLVRKGNAILLLQRAKTESLMPGMWELPEVSVEEMGAPPLFTLAHAITVTDFKVRVVESTPARAGTWIRVGRLTGLPLTGLTKKILRRAQIID